MPTHGDVSNKPQKRQASTASRSADSPLEVRNAREWSERFSDLTADLNLFLGVMTAIGVSIATLSIVNTMLMSVSERLIEFGVLKANGWSRTDVLTLITCESATLGVAGGLLGSMLGWIVVQIINSQWPERVQLYASPGLLIFSVFFAAGLGVLGGLYPAIWAMRASPMEAIRRG
jgi:putative ABC transport system permease protein